MKVFRPLEIDRPSNTLYVAPAASESARGVSEWLRADGEPLTIPVEFKYGVAHVPGNLGRWLIDAGHAQNSPIILAA